MSFIYLENLQPITSEIYGIAPNMTTLRKIEPILFYFLSQDFFKLDRKIKIRNIGPFFSFVNLKYVIFTWIALF